MKIVFVGPGGMGCLFSGLFTQAGHDVWLLDKDRERAETIAANGVRIDDSSGASRVIRVRITAAPATIGIADIVCICVKSFDTELAVNRSLSVIGSATVAVSMQNGLGNAEQIACVVDRTRIVCGVTAHGATCLGPGHIRHAGSGRTSVAAMTKGNREIAALVAGLLSESGIDTAVSDDVRGLLWSKLIINAAVNPLTALYDARNGRLLADPQLRATMQDAAREAAVVASVAGISLNYSDAVAEVESVCRGTADNVSSMLQDVRRGRRTEIDSITGVIVDRAHEAGVAVPVNEMLLERVHRLEHGLTSSI